MKNNEKYDKYEDIVDEAVYNTESTEVMLTLHGIWCVYNAGEYNNPADIYASADDAASAHSVVLSQTDRDEINAVLAQLRAA